LPEDFEEEERHLVETHEARKKSGDKGAPAARKTPNNLITDLATKHKVDPSRIRKHLRSQGLRAPYEDKTAITKAMKGFKP